jgi:hypothetical protein
MVNDRNMFNLQGAIEIEENLSPSFSSTCGFLPLVAPAPVAPPLLLPLAPALPHRPIPDFFPSLNTAWKWCGGIDSNN